MAATDVSITFAAALLWEAPGGNVALADGGVVKYDPGSGTITFESEHPDFGTIAGFDTFDTGTGDNVDGGVIDFAPPSSATLSNWWRTDLENTRMRLWVGEIDSDGVTLTGEEVLADWLVDTASREQGAAGSDILSVEFMTRLEKLFEINQGNVCSDTFHRSIWSNERGFENCHDGAQYFAWGTEAPRGSGASFSSGGGGGFGGGINDGITQQER